MLFSYFFNFNFFPILYFFLPQAMTKLFRKYLEATKRKRRENVTRLVLNGERVRKIADQKKGHRKENLEKS